jgi:hypothetical protein
MTRALQNRLALASIKIQNGWGTLPLQSLEPQIEQELKRKRPTSSSNGGLSDSSSSASDPLFPSAALDSSPLTAPVFSDDLARSGGSLGSKRARRDGYRSTHHPNPRRVSSMSHAPSWKKAHRLPASSPAFRGHGSRFASNPDLSFVAEVDDGALSHSEEDDSDLPLHSFQVAASREIRSSPPPRIPRTPSPDMARSARLRGKPFNANARSDDAADLLMFLAASPSPAAGGRAKRESAAMNPPSTPPQKTTPLPSSMLSTPGGGNGGFLGMGATTPGGLGFSFSDYLNVTPSPAQAAWRTPGGVARTPLVREGARRRLNFDALMPPSAGNTPELPPAEGKLTGLGMELGGELVSSQ